MNTTIKQVANIRSGYPFRSRLSHEPDGRFAVVQMKDIDADSILNTRQLTRTSQIEFPSSQHLKQGDLLFRARGQTNTAALVNTDIGPAVVAAPMFLIRAVHVEPRYLQWFINLPGTQQKLSELSVGTALQMVSKASLELLSIPVPSTRTQKQIVEIAQLKFKEQELMKILSELRRRCVDATLLEVAKNSC